MSTLANTLQPKTCAKFERNCLQGSLPSYHIIQKNSDRTATKWRFHQSYEGEIAGGEDGKLGLLLFYHTVLFIEFDCKTL